MRRLAALLLLGAMIAPGLVLADQSLSGEDAAYIDWGVKNCELTSTDKEHVLVEQANAKSRDTFIRQYQGKNLADALASPSKQGAMCADIKTWYGPQGTRFADLIKWESTVSPAAADKPAASTTGNRKGRHRSSQ